jgi:hypothetical protein
MTFRISAILILIVAVVGIAAYMLKPATPAQDDLTSAHDIAIRFGDALQQVSLMGPEDQVGQDMDSNYAALVSPQLLAKWKADPLHAPGRLTSSPWPDHIQIATTTKQAPSRYAIEGSIIYVTSEGGGIGEAPAEAARQPVHMIVEKTDTDWRITEVTLGAYPAGAQWRYSHADASGMQFMYPVSLGTSYISTSTEGWPPTAAIVSGTLSCAATDKRMIGDRAYCITRESEGAAGSTFTTYTYATMQGTSVASTTFTLRFPQCMNYDDPQQSACTIEESSYDIDGLADRIISSIRKAE